MMCSKRFDGRAGGIDAAIFKVVERDVALRFDNRLNTGDKHGQILRLWP